MSRYRIQSFLFYIGMVYHEYIYSPVRKRYLLWKYRKDIEEVKRKYTESGAFNVICDHTNNTPESLERRELNVDFTPPKTISYIKLDFIVNKDGGIQFSEIVNGNTMNRVENAEK